MAVPIFYSFKMPIGSQIKRHRTSKGITQLELEIKTNLSHGVISRIESNKINPTKETLIRIARELELQNQEIASLFGFQFEKF